MWSIRFLSLTTYINIVTDLHKLHKSVGKQFNYDIGKCWASCVTSNDVAIKAADMVMYDRMLNEQT